MKSMSLSILILLLAAAGASAAASDVRLPAPAFFSGGISRAVVVEADTLLLTKEDGKTVTLRLLDADCQGFDRATLDRAKTVAEDLLHMEAAWIFPRGQTKGPSGDELWAEVWTAKGWLGEAIVKAGYAKTPTLDTASLAPPDLAGVVLKGSAPSAPAFACQSCSTTDGSLFELEGGGRNWRVRLAGIEVDPGRAAVVKEAVTRLTSGGSAWVFPANSGRPGPDGQMYVRLWTQEGWLADVLVKAGAARMSTSPTPSAASVPASGATAPNNPPPSSPPSGKSGGGASWNPISVSKARSMPRAWFSSHFQVHSRTLRISWNLKPAQTGLGVDISLFRMNDEQGPGGITTHVQSFGSPAGSEILYVLPGEFWFKVTGSEDTNVKLEEYVGPK